MKKTIFLLFVFCSVFILTLAVVFLTSGDKDAMQPADSSVYVLDPFFPPADGADASGGTDFRSTGTYTLSDDGSLVYVVRSVSDTSNITLSKGVSLDLFGSAELSNVVFAAAENMTASPESFDAAARSPTFVTLDHDVKKTNSGRFLVLNESFTGLVCYTLSQTGGHTILVNDESAAVRIYLPDGISTGNPVFGKASPKPDLSQKTDDGRTLLQWNDTQAVSVQYYDWYAPWAMGLIVAGLVMFIGLLFLRHYLQMKAIREVIYDVDPNNESGFRKQRR